MNPEKRAEKVRIIGVPMDLNISELSLQWTQWIPRSLPVCCRKKGDSLLFSVVADLCAPEASSTGKKVDCPLSFRPRGSVGTPVEGGLTYREAHLAMEMVFASGRCRSLGVVELNPVIDSANRTARLAVGLVCSALGKKILA